MAIAYVSDGHTSGAGVTSLTTAAWTISGSDTFLIVGVGSSGGAQSVSAVKWGGSGGTSLTQVGSTASGFFFNKSMWRLIAPSSSSSTLYASFGGTIGEGVLGGIGYSGVHQTTPLGTPASYSDEGASNTSITVNVAAATGDVVVDFLYVTTDNAIDWNVGAGQTNRWEEFPVSTEQGSMSEEAGATTVTMSWSGTENAYYGSNIQGVAIKPSAAASGIPKQMSNILRLTWA